MSATKLPRQIQESIAGNIAEWTANNAKYTDPYAERAWAEREIAWGIFQVRDADIGPPLGDVSGLDIVELGCGTAYFSAQLAMHGARPVGVDPTPAQLATARRMQAQTGIVFPLIEAPGERVPLPDASFDLAFSEYGASLWADPDLWIPEAARLLRPSGRLVFLTNSIIAYLCFPDLGPVTDSLQRPMFGMGRIQWPGPGTEYHRSPGSWIALLRANGFEVEDLVEVRPPADAVTHSYYDDIPVDWARRWPAEEIWVARKRG